MIPDVLLSWMIGIATVCGGHGWQQRQLDSDTRPVCPLTSAWSLSPGETKEGYYQPLEKAEMVRSGGDVTILCYSRMRYVVMQAVAQLEKEGYDPEVRCAAQAAL